MNEKERIRKQKTPDAGRPQGLVNVLNVPKDLAPRSLSGLGNRNADFGSQRGRHVGFGIGLDGNRAQWEWSLERFGPLGVRYIGVRYRMQYNPWSTSPKCPTSFETIP